MPIPQQPRFGEFLRRLFQTKEWPSPQLLDDWFPSIDLLADRPEYRKLRDENSFVAGSRGIGSTANGGRVWLMNKKPNQLAIVNRIVISAIGTMTSAVFVDERTGLPSDGAGGQSIVMSQDTRYDVTSPGGTPPANVTVANDVSPVTAGIPIGLPSSVPVVYPCDYVLRPGYGLMVVSANQGVGQDIFVSFWGYSRAVEDNELK